MRAVHQSLARLQAPRHVAITPVHYIELSRLEPSSRAPRRTMEDANLERLADSLLRHGPLQPVLVGPERNGRYELIFGLRRYYAACAAGLRALPALIWEGPPEDAEVLALVENLAREDLNPVDEARALDALRRRHGLSTRALAELIGKSHTYVVQRLHWLQDEQVVAALCQGLAPSNAVELMAVADPDRRHALLQDLLDGRLQFARLRAERRVLAARRPAREETPYSEAISPTALVAHVSAPSLAERAPAVGTPHQDEVRLAVRTLLHRMLALANPRTEVDDLLHLARHLLAVLETAPPTVAVHACEPDRDRVWHPRRTIRCVECTIMIGPEHLHVDAYPGPAEGVWWCVACTDWARRQATRQECPREAEPPHAHASALA